MEFIHERASDAIFVNSLGSHGTILIQWKCLQNTVHDYTGGQIIVSIVEITYAM